MTNETQRSKEACPVCGAHELELLNFPSIDVTGARPYDELLGMGDVRREEPPGIGCRACGESWPTLEEFREAARRS